jgi:hypothetical protein
MFLGVVMISGLLPDPKVFIFSINNIALIEEEMDIIR